jgi:hypothetical protein
MPALMFIPQPASELAFDIFVNQPEVPSGVEPREVRAPTPQNRIEPRGLLAQLDSRFPPDEDPDFVPDALHRPTRGPAVTELPTAWRLLLTEVHAEEVKPRTCRHDARSSLTVTRNRANIAWSFDAAQEVGGGHSSDEGKDNKTCRSEGPLLEPSFYGRRDRVTAKRLNARRKKRSGYFSESYTERPRHNHNERSESCTTRSVLKSDEFSFVFLRRLRFGDGRRPIAL